MATRLGKSLFWLSIIIAAVWLVLGYYDIKNRPSGVHDAVTLIIIFGIAIIIVAIGWALRHIVEKRQRR